MSQANHATTGSDGSYCCCCSSSMGTAAKVHPMNVDGESWCPRCFVWVRMHQEPNRWQAHFTAAVQCQFCGFVTVALGTARMGTGQCGHCGAGGALVIRPKPEDERELLKLIEAMRSTVKDKGGVVLQPGVR